MKHISKSKCIKHISLGPLLEVEMSKSARRCGTKHISKSKCTKHTSFGPLLLVEMSKKCTPLWREAHFKVKMLKTLGVRTTFGGSDVASLRFASLNYTTLHYTTLHYTTLHYTTLHYATTTTTQLHSTTLHYTPLHSTTLNYTTLHYTTLHYTTLHYTTSTLHYTTLHYDKAGDVGIVLAFFTVPFFLSGSEDLLHVEDGGTPNRNHQSQGKFSLSHTVPA